MLIEMEMMSFGKLNPEEWGSHKGRCDIEGLQIDRQIHRQIDRQMDGWIDRQIGLGRQIDD